MHTFYTLTRRAGTFPHWCGAHIEEEDVDPVFSAPVSSERSEVLYTPEDQIIPSDEQLPEAIKVRLHLVAATKEMQTRVGAHESATPSLPPPFPHLSSHIYNELIDDFLFSSPVFNQGRDDFHVQSLTAPRLHGVLHTAALVFMSQSFL